MTDTAFSNRELTAKFDGIHEKLDNLIIQTTKTNGRVSTLEKWQSYVIGFCAAISLLMLPAFFIIMRNYIGG